MSGILIPQLLIFDIKKVHDLIQEAGTVFNQEQKIINQEKKWVGENLMFELNSILYGKKVDGLKSHIIKYKENNSEVYDDWLSCSFEGGKYTPGKEALYELFKAKYMMDCYEYIYEENCSKKKTQYEKTQKLSYHWQGSPDELTELYQKMTASNLIAEDTAEADFKAIFKAEPLDTIKPIRWAQTKVLLAYFIYKLSRANKGIGAKDNHWTIAELCFKDAKNLKQSCQSFLGPNKLPKNHQLIDLLF